MARQFNESRTKRPTLNAAPRLVLKPCHSERGRLPRRSYGEAGRNLLLLTADYADFRLRIFRDGSAALTGVQAGANYSCTRWQNKKPPRGEAERLIARYCCVQNPIITGK